MSRLDLQGIKRFTIRSQRGPAAACCTSWRSPLFSLALQLTALQAALAAWIGSALKKQLLRQSRAEAGSSLISGPLCPTKDGSQTVGVCPGTSVLSSKSARVTEVQATPATTSLPLSPLCRPWTSFLPVPKLPSKPKRDRAASGRQTANGKALTTTNQLPQPAPSARPPPYGSDARTPRFRDGRPSTEREGTWSVVSINETGCRWSVSFFTAAATAKENGSRLAGRIPFHVSKRTGPF